MSFPYSGPRASNVLPSKLFLSSPTAVAAFLIALVMMPARMSAQVAGNIGGTVTFSGTAIPGNATTTLYVSIPSVGGNYVNTSGGYSFSTIEPGTYTESVYDNGCSTSSLLGQGSYTVTGGNTTTANIDLAATAGRVQGTIYLNGMGTTANITINGLCGQWQTAADGTFTHYLAAGSYTASVNNSSGGSLGTFSFTITAGQTTNAGNKFFSTSSVSGTVLWNGAAVSTTAVTTMLASISNVGSSLVTSTGTYSISPISPGAYTLNLYGNDCSPSITFGSSSFSVTGGSSTTQNIDITSATGRVSGTITVNGVALASPMISISGACQQWQTQTNGTFLQYLLPGTYTANVAGTSGTIGSFGFTITAGQTTNVGTINFTTGNLTVTPTFKSAAIANPSIATLHAFVNSSPVTGSALSPTLANFPFTNLVPGSYTVSIYQNNCAVAAGQLASATANVTGGGTTTLNVELSAGAGLVTGTATVNGSALPNPQISISGLCGTWASKSDGTYFQYLPPGTYTAQVTGPSGGSLGTFTFTIVAGQTTIANFPATIVAPTTATVSAVSAPAGSTAGVTVTATESGSAGVVTGGVVTFSVIGTATGSFSPTTCTLSSAGTCTTSYIPTGSLAAGTYSNDIQASFAANNGYSAATATSTLSIATVTPTITFTVPTHHTIDVPFNVSATSNSTGTLTYSVVSGPASISGSTVTLTGAGGTVQLMASQAANGNYGSSSQTATFNVVAGSVWLGNAGGSLSIFGSDGAALKNSTGGGAGTIATPLGEAFDSAGKLWVASSNGVSAFAENGTAVQSTAYTGGGVSSPVSLAVDGAGLIWVANSNSTVSVLSNSGSAVSPSTGYPATASGTPGGLMIDLSGNVWVTNQNANTVTEILGAATPAAPPSTALANGSTGAKP